MTVAPAAVPVTIDMNISHNHNVVMLIVSAQLLNSAFKIFQELVSRERSGSLQRVLFFHANKPPLHPSQEQAKPFEHYHSSIKKTHLFGSGDLSDLRPVEVVQAVDVLHHALAVGLDSR